MDWIFNKIDILNGLDHRKNRLNYKKWIFCPPLIRILWHISSHIECQNKRLIKKYCLPKFKHFSKIIHVMIANICKSFKLLLLHKVSFPISGKIMFFLFFRSIRNLKKDKQQRRTLAILQLVNQSTNILWKNQYFSVIMWDVQRETWEVLCGMWKVKPGCDTWDVGRATWNVRRETWDVERWT